MGIIRPVGEKAYKFRVGNYRPTINLDNNRLIVLVVNIGHRKNRYK